MKKNKLIRDSVLTLMINLIIFLIGIAVSFVSHMINPNDSLFLGIFFIAYYILILIGGAVCSVFLYISKTKKANRTCIFFAVSNLLISIIALSILLISKGLSETIYIYILISVLFSFLIIRKLYTFSVTN